MTQEKELDQDGLDASELRADGGNFEDYPWYSQYQAVQAEINKTEES